MSPRLSIHFHDIVVLGFGPQEPPGLKDSEVQARASCLSRTWGFGFGAR